MTAVPLHNLEARWPVSVRNGTPLFLVLTVVNLTDMVLTVVNLTDISEGRAGILQKKVGTVLQ